METFSVRTRWSTLSSLGSHGHLPSDSSSPGCLAYATRRPSASRSSRSSATVQASCALLTSISLVGTIRGSSWVATAPPAVAKDIVGERLAQTIARRRPTADVYHRRTDGVVVIAQQLLVRLSPTTGGQPDIKWNQVELGKHGRQDQELPANLAKGFPRERQTPPSARSAVGVARHAGSGAGAGAVVQTARLAELERPACLAAMCAAW